MATRKRSFALVFTAAACVVLAACGSQVPPGQFVNAQGALLGAGHGSTGGAAVAGEGASAVPTQSSAAAAGGTAGGAAAGGGTGGGAAAGGAAAGGGGGGTSGGGAANGVQPGSCAGFKNGTGVTDSTITIANVADVSGPVPGLFQGAQQAMKAFVSYFNSTSSICGRKLSLEALDSQTSSTGDQQAATTACGNAFAMIGSMGAFDDGGANTVTQCGIPDLRSAMTTGARAASPVVFGAQSLRANLEPTAPADFYKTAYPGVADKAAFLWLDAGASSINAKSEIAGWKSRGYNFVYTAAIPVTAFSYDSYATAMASAGVKYVQYVGAYQNAVRLKQAMDKQGINAIFVMDPTGYDPGYVKAGGPDAEGTHIWINSETFEDAAGIPEMQLYKQWLARVAPGAAPSYFGLFAWAAGRLFAQEAIKLGGQLTRASFVASLKAVDNYTGNGLFGPQHVGAKVTGSCYGFIVLKGGQWVREGPKPYTCGSTVDTGIS